MSDTELPGPARKTDPPQDEALDETVPPPADSSLADPHTRALEPENQGAAASGDSRTDEGQLLPEEAVTLCSEVDRVEHDANTSRSIQNAGPAPEAGGGELPDPSALPVPKADVQAEVKDFHFPPLINGLDFLVSAVKSLAAEGGPAPRELKYAVVHLQTAAEILFKVRLEMRNPALVWTKPHTFDEAKHNAGDFKSCGIELALKRLGEDVGIESSIDAKDPGLKSLGELRNRIVHFGLQDTAIAVQTRTVPVLGLLVGFINADVLPHVDTPANSWAAEQEMEKVRAELKHLTDFVQHRREAISDRLDGHERSTVACRSCGQYAVVLDGGAVDLECLFCGKTYGTGLDAAWEYIGESRHVTIKDGGDDLAQCTSCADAAVVEVRAVSSPDTAVFICFACGSEHEGICASCGCAGYLMWTNLCEDCHEIRFDNF
ncbi:hypothetical protein ABZ613_02775 [Streptomyces collinus]|uniref:hypothetical protein n=1 Tax=Streptomyces collinus TaxID=42684 RepID=UPI0033C7AD12